MAIECGKSLEIVLLLAEIGQARKNPREFAAEQQDSAGFMDVLPPENR